MEFQNAAVATSDLIDNKIADKITKNLHKNNSESIRNRLDKKIPKERYISTDKKQEIIDDLTLM